MGPIIMAAEQGLKGFQIFAQAAETARERKKVFRPSTEKK